MRKYILYILIVITVAGLFSPTIKASAQTLGICTYIDSFGNPHALPDRSKEECTGIGGTWKAAGYTLLAPLPCETGTPGCTNEQLKTFDPTTGLSSYLNLMIKLFIGICAVLSVVMIVVGGLEVMTSELAHTKEAGKERITHAILGLLIALGAYALLFTINPDLLRSDVDKNITNTTVTVRGGCLLSNGTIIQTTQDGCILNPNSQSWNGIITPSARGKCIFRQASNLERTEAITTKANCELNGTRMISWTINPQ